MRKQFVRLGVQVEQLPPDETEEELIEVWSPNWPVMRVFLACETQWRASATMAGLIWLGLDYAAVEIVMRRLGFDDIAWADLQAMEAAALGVLNSGAPA